MDPSPAPKKSKSREPEPLLDTTTGPWLETIEFNFPPFAVLYDHGGRVLVCGGGGESKTGVPNKLIIIEASRTSEITLDSEKSTSGASGTSSSFGTHVAKAPILMRKVCVYDTGRDAIMNMALHPFENLIACGVGSRCAVYNVGHRNFQKIAEVQTDFAEQEEDRGQKRVRFSPCGRYIFCSGGDGFVRMYAFPSLTLIKQFEAHSLESEKETTDLTVTNKMLATTTRRRCLIYDIQTGALIHSLTPQNNKLSFRDSRFCPVLLEMDEDDVFDDDGSISPSNMSVSSSTTELQYLDGSDDSGLDDTGVDQNFSSTASSPVHSSPSSSSLSRSQLNRISKVTKAETILEQPDSSYLYTTEFLPQQSGIIRKWDTTTWKCVKSKTIRFNGDHLTAFGISSDGTTCAIGSVEGQVRVLDASNLAELRKWPTKHEFFVTDFSFETQLSEPLSLAQMQPTGSISLEESIHQRQLQQSEIGSKTSAAIATQAPKGPKAKLLRDRKDRMLFSASGDNTLRATLAPNLAPKQKKRTCLGSLCSISFWVLLHFLVLILAVVLAQIYHPETVKNTWTSLGNQILEKGGYDASAEIQTASQHLQLLSVLIKQSLEALLNWKPWEQ